MIPNQTTTKTKQKTKRIEEIIFLFPLYFLLLLSLLYLVRITICFPLLAMSFFFFFEIGFSFLCFKFHKKKLCVFWCVLVLFCLRYRCFVAVFVFIICNQASLIFFFVVVVEFRQYLSRNNQKLTHPKKECKTPTLAGFSIYYRINKKNRLDIKKKK